ncbi:MAG: cbb3-type cytochrome oxidase assembly protein [Parachlamydiaceae bacterium]|nr:cbb3-type cytochrome oxidase assembly protein [Parachlamydiaceae bacterium]
MFWYIISSTMMAIAGVMLYIYYLRKGQFEDSEDVKYQIFREDE